ncbi:MAG: hypothetical protein ASARMPREDX12_007675 [Alectoria sarmentosa]|nr:MAG: hypothetical protein ASARMPREDX12_007675 [Alectoria sarmentosa]
MDTSNPSLAIQHHLAIMPSFSSSSTPTALISNRIGVENMDGHGILSTQPKSYARPWLGCIPIEQLTRDNLPPFYVRLQDSQVGHLAFWVGTSRGSITRLKLGQVWPWDFDVQGKVSSRRDNWGAEYDGCGKERGKGLGGGKKVPSWTDPGLPLTYTSSHKVMAGELDALRKGAAVKRKAEEEAGRNACMPVKKPRLGKMSIELKAMKEKAEKKRQRDKTTDMEKERYAGAKPDFRDAMQVVDTLMRSATETQNQNAMLETLLLKNEIRYIKDTDDMFDEWLAYNQTKRMEVDRIHQDHAIEIKSRSAKIEALETEAKGLKARLDKEKQKVRVRDERLARVKSRWTQEQDLMDRKVREMQDMAVDIDELPELSYDADESEDDEEEEADFEVEPEKAEEEVKEVKEAKEVQKQEPRTPNEQEMTGLTKQGLKEPMDKESKKSIERQKVKSVDPRELVQLDEDEDEEDEGPVSSQRKAKLRSLIRSKATQSV